MKILVVGLGGVGGYIAANIKKAGFDIDGVARGEHLKAIKENGLKIIEDDKTYTVDLDVYQIDELKELYDVVIFCVKSYDLEDACKNVLKNIKNDALIVTFLNGVGHFEKLSTLCDNEISQGVIYILSHIKSPGVIRKKGKVFAAVFAEDKKGILKEIFKKSSLRYKISSDITKDIWKKYIFISAFANLTSYYDKSIYEVYNQHTTQTKEVLCEIAKIAKAKGIDIDEEVEKSLKTASSLPKDASTSMHKDFKNSKKTELEALSGYLVNEAKRLNINIPQISKIYAKLKMKS
jgi:2-dehydropantoate 2-reductase